MAKTWYVYLLCDPDTEQPFYVGKGTGDRMHYHERALDSFNNVNTAKKDAIRRILAQGKQVLKKKVAEFDDEQEAYAYETMLIKQYGTCLTNIKSSDGRRHHDRPSEIPVRHLTYKKGDPYVKIDDAAQILGMTTPTLYRRMRLFGIKPIRFKDISRRAYISNVQVKQIKEAQANPWLAPDEPEKEIEHE